MINTNSLRMKILDLAIRGKLVLNDENEATPLISPLKGDEVLDEDKQFEIPPNWRWARIGWIMDIERGASPRPIKDFLTTDEDGIKWIKIGDAERDGKYIYETREKIKFEGVQKSRKVYPDDFLLTNSMSFGRPYISKIEGCVHDGWLILRNSKKMFYNDFLYYFLSSKYAYMQFCKKASGSTVENLNIDKVASAVVPVPPIKEQVRIVEQIEKAYAYIKEIDDVQKNYEINLRVLKTKLIDAGIRGKLSEQLPEDGNVEDLYAKIQAEETKILEKRKGKKDKRIKDVEKDVPFEIPNHWKWIRLGDIGLFKKGPFGSALTKAMFVQKGTDTVKVYEQQHAIKKDCELGTYYITREYFNEKMSGFEVMSGDIIVSCAGTIGETYIMPDEIEQGIINQALMRVTLAEGIDKNFFQYYFDANLKKNAQEESNGSAIKNIPPFEVLKNWYFPLTSIEEQRRIVSKVDEILAYM